MIKIKVFKDEKNLIKQIELTGHAGYADSGYDIVCAAVSSQVISVENSLHQLLNIAVETEVNEVEGGYLKLTMPVVSDEKLSENGQLLLNHLVFALQVLSQNYSEFIKIQEKTLDFSGQSEEYDYLYEPYKRIDEMTASPFDNMMYNIPYGIKI